MVFPSMFAKVDTNRVGHKKSFFFIGTYHSMVTVLVIQSYVTFYVSSTFYLQPLTGALMCSFTFAVRRIGSVFLTVLCNFQYVVCPLSVLKSHQFHDVVDHCFCSLFAIVNGSSIMRDTEDAIVTDVEWLVCPSDSSRFC